MPGKEFVSFDKFIKATKVAKFTDYKGLPSVAVQSEKEFEAMKAHILGYYDGVTSTHSFMLAGDQYIDCVPFAQQPSLRNAVASEKVPATPPSGEVSPADGGVGTPGVPAQPAKVQADIDPFGNARSCPEGSIPMPRLTLETMTRFPTLDAFFGQGSKQAPP